MESKKRGDMMKRALPIGVDDYRRLKENNYYAVDKTLMISRISSKTVNCNSNYQTKKDLEKH